MEPELTFSQKNECDRFHSIHLNNLNILQNVQLLFHLPLYISLQQRLNEFRLGSFVDMMKSNKILAEAASNEQSIVKPMVYKMETLPVRPTNWVNASVSNLHTLKNPEKK